MTTTDPTQSTAAAAPPPPPPTPEPAAEPADSAQPAATQAQEDQLAKLTYHDIPGLKDQIRKMTDITPAQLQEVIYGTVMSVLKQMGVEVYRLRSWSLKVREDDVDVLTEVIQRLEEVETLVYGGESQLTVADADMFTNVVSGYEAFIEQALQHTVDTEGRRTLESARELCAQAKSRIEEIVMVNDDDDDDGGDTPTAAGA